MTPEVSAAISEVRQTFPDHEVTADADPDGGAFVIVHNLLIGDAFHPPTSWVGFQLSFQYPFGDVYPHYIDGAIQRADGQPLQAPITLLPSPWRGCSALQISRRTRNWNPNRDTAAIKLNKVLEFLRDQS